MIRSMTAFARHDITGIWGTASWELRSLNQRYLENYIHLPEQFRSLEPVIRDRLRTYITRGKVECHLRLSTIDDGRGIFINEPLAKQLLEAAKWVKRQSNEGEIDPLNLLRWPGVMVAEQPELDTISAELLTGLEITLHDLIQARETEGMAIKKMITQRLDRINAEVAKVRRHMPDVLAWQRERIFKKLEYKDILFQLDPNRLEQELVMLAQRVDVAEELDRLEANVKTTYNILNQPDSESKEAVGRRLDFMMQELNRESNTLASKSINTSVTASAIELKVIIEQMREHIQNIE